MAFQQVETGRQEELFEASYVKCSKVTILYSHARTETILSDRRKLMLEDFRFALEIRRKTPRDCAVRKCAALSLQYVAKELRLASKEHIFL